MNKIISNIYLLFLFFCLTFIQTNLPAQTKNKAKKAALAKKPIAKKVEEKPASLTPEEIVEYKQKVARLVSFLEFALNTIGSDSTDADDKEIIINKSYLKFFKNAEVQIEDDLDKSRITSTYKNVQAYLQDIDYFFTLATFELNIDEIAIKETENKDVYFIVSLTRYLSYKLLNGDSITNSQQRFVEINLNLKEKDLKIASIYTTQYNENADLLSWWKQVPAEWKQVFATNVSGTDSLNHGQIKRILSTDSIDISNNKDIKSIDPINRFSNLKYFNVSNTNVNDLLPLRNLVSLESLNIQGTSVSSLAPLKYLTQLKIINLSNSLIQDLGTLSLLPQLININASNTPVKHLGTLASNTQLIELDISATQVENIDTLRNLSAIETLNISRTRNSNISELSKLKKLKNLDLSYSEVTDLSSLADLPILESLYIHHTGIESLQNLKNAPMLKTIWCDESKISALQASDFMQAKPGCLVIYQSKTLRGWWAGLSADWKRIFQQQITMDTLPNDVQLSSLGSLRQLNFSSNTTISNLEALAPLSHLQKLVINKTRILSLAALSNKKFLSHLEFANTLIDDLSPLDSITTLTYLNIDNTNIGEEQIGEFKRKHPNCLVVHESDALNIWWNDLPGEWQKLFQSFVPYESSPANSQLHQIILIDSINISNHNNITELDALSHLKQLRILMITNTAISSLEAIRDLTRIHTLIVSNNPIKDLAPIHNLYSLQKLDFEDTGVSELTDVVALKELRILKMAGTPVKSLKPLTLLEKLEYLDCSSTLINNLKPLEKNKAIKYLKCYNTKISAKSISKFQKQHPDCQVVHY